jgi:hypothetical protein
MSFTLEAQDDPEARLVALSTLMLLAVIVVLALLILRSK